MNYKKRDDELIRLQKEDMRKLQKLAAMDVGNNSGNVGYSQKALNALAKGRTKAFRSGASRDTSTHSGSKGYSAKALSTLSGGNNKLSQKENKNKVPSVQKNKAKPSTRYDKPNVTTQKQRQSTRDTRFDKDFDNFYNYRFTHADMLDDYKEGQEARPYWQKVKEDIMAKNKWSDKEFEAKWNEYNKERQQKDADKEVSDAVELAKKHPALATLLQYGMTPQTWIEGGATVLSGLLPVKNKATSADDTMFTGSRVQDAIRQTVKDEHINSGVGKFAYDMGVGLPDMVGGPLGMGAQSAVRSHRDALERGVDADKAALTGALTGGASAAINKVGLDKVFGATGKTALGALGKAFLSEGAEEVVEDSTALGIDAFINKNKSQLSALHDYYTSQGMDDKAAWGKVAADTSRDMAASFLAGGVFGAAMNGTANLPALTAEIGDRIKYNRKGNADIQNILNGKVPELKPTAEADTVIQDAIESQQAAEAEIKKLQEQLPPVPEQVPEVEPNAQDMKWRELREDEPNRRQVIDGQGAGETAPVNIAEQAAENSSVDPAYELASRVAAVSDDFDAYNYMDNMYEMDSFVDQLADEIRNGRDLSGLIEIMEDSLDSAGEPEVRDSMQSVINELYKANEGRGQDGKLSPEEVKTLQDVVDGKYDIPETGETAPEPTFEENMRNLEIARLRSELDINSQMQEMIKTGRAPDGSTVIISNADADLRRLVGDRANLEKQLDGLLSQAEKDNNDIDALQAFVNSQKQNANKDRVAGESAPKIESNIHSKDGRLLSNTKIPEYTMGEDVYFNGSDDDIALAEAQDKAIVDTFRNIISDPEFNALSFKNGNKEVFVSPATNGNGLRMSYTIDGVPTGHHDYSLDQIGELSNSLRNEVGNGGEDIKIQRKSDLTGNPTKSPIKEQSQTFTLSKDVDSKGFKKEVNSIISAFTGSVNWIKDTDNTYAQQVKKALADFKNNPSTETLANLKEAHDLYAENSGSAYKRNWNGEWKNKVYHREKVDNLIDGIVNKYNSAELSNGETAPVENKVAAEKAEKNPTITSKPLEGAELEKAKATRNENLKRIKELNKLIPEKQAEFDELKTKKSKGAQSKKAGQELAALKKEKKQLQQANSELAYTIKGEERPFKRYMQENDRNAYNAIYGMDGVMGKLDYATHFAGDTPEAIALRDEIKKIINDTVQSGEFPDEGALWQKIEQLDAMASAAKKPFTSSKGKNYDYDSFFQSYTDKNGNEVPSNEVLNWMVNEANHDALRSHKAKAVKDRITNTLNSDSFEPVTFTGDMGQQYRVEKGDDGFNLVTLDEDGSPVWLDKLKDPKALISKINKVEKDGVKLLDEALSKPAPEESAVEAPKNEVPNVKPPEPPVETPENDVTHLNGMMPKDNGPGNVPPEPPIISEPPRSENMGESKVVTNTAINADVINQDMYDNDPVLQEIAKYAKANNETTYNAAVDNVKSNGTQLLDEYISGKRKIDNDLDVDQSMLLLTNLATQIQDMGADAPADIVSQRNLLLSRLRQAGTHYGQTIQAFAKWNNTADGALINGERLLQEPVEQWKSTNKKKTEMNAKIAKALANMGADSSVRNKEKPVKTREQIRQGVENVLAREYGSVENYFNDADIDFLTDLAQDKTVPVWQITDEIEHKMNHGEWYPIEKEETPKRPTNSKLQNALDALIEREDVVKEPPTLEELREQVKNTLDKEAAGLGKKESFTDEDVDYLANLINNGATREELTDALNTKLATGRFGISADTQQKVNDLFAYADQFDPNSKQAFDAKSAAYKLIADETVGNASLFDKFEAWRYLAMLGNPKTMARNWVGNKMFGAVTGVSNNLSAVLEAGTDKLSKALGGEGIQRTKAVLNPAKDSGLIKACGEDGEAHRFPQLSGSKYEKGTREAIKQQKSVFNSKLIQLYEKATDAGVSDYKAVKKKYSTSLAGYMKANGLDESAFNADNKYRELKKQGRSRVLTDAEKTQMESLKETADKLEKARDYAVSQAEYATFHEDNAVAKWLTETSKKAPGPLKMVIEGLIPFKKTPANILRSGVDYSPLGAIESIRKTGKLIYENTGKRKGNLEDTYTKTSKLTGKTKDVDKTLAADVLDSWSKTLTGTGLVALGYYLKNKGILNSSNKDEKYQDDLEGIQNYSITINGKTYTVDWAAPAIMPMLVGAEISKIKDRANLLDKNVYENMDEIVGTVNALLDPIFETSMMQGIKNTAESIANSTKYNDGEGVVGGILGSALTNTATSYLTQGLPTLSGQIARTVDPTRRSSDTATDSAFWGGVEKQGRKLLNKVPGLSRLNTPYRDAYGRTQNNSPFNNPLANLAYQTLSPAYIRDIDTTKADESARQTYYSKNSEGQPILDKDVFPAWKGKVTVDGHKFTPQEMEKYRQVSGEANYAIRDELAKNEWFNSLDGAKQTEILKKTNTLVDKLGKEANGSPQESKDLDAYNEGGIPFLIEKWRSDYVNKEITEVTGMSSSTNLSKEIAEEMLNGNTEVVQQKMQDAAQSKQNLDALNEKYGTKMNMSDYLKYEEKGGAEAHLQKRQSALDYGFVQKDGTANYDAYDRAVSVVGNNPSQLKAYADFAKKGYKKNVHMVPELRDNNSFSADQKGKIIMAEHGYQYDDLGKMAKAAYDIGGSAGVYYYYMLKDYADANRDGSLNKNEKAALKKFMQSDSPYVTQIPDELFYYLGNSKW